MKVNISPKSHEVVFGSLSVGDAFVYSEHGLFIKTDPCSEGTTPILRTAAQLSTGRMWSFRADDKVIPREDVSVVRI